MKHIRVVWRIHAPRSRGAYAGASPLRNARVAALRYAAYEFGKSQAQDALQHLLTGSISNSAVDVVRGPRSVEVRSVLRALFSVAGGARSVEA